MIKELRAREKEEVNKAVESTRKENLKALEMLQTQLAEKEKEYADLKRTFEESKESSIREQRLISSAFYEIGLELQRLKAPKAMEFNPAASGPPTTFLKEQREKINK
jgi:hypothetical protein